MSPSRSDAITARSIKAEVPVWDRESNGDQRDLFLEDRVLPLSVLLVGFVARLVQAKQYFLNPDEALHYLLASQPSVSLAYKAALTNAHPPLLILVLYYWRALGHSELILRMPSVLAGTACCWITYLWLKLVADRSTALTGLLLFSLAPSLVGLSAEIRQYALLLFFMSGCLYLSERAIRDDSLVGMILFSVSLYGALLTHYSSLIFAFTLGVYLGVRLYPYGKRLRLVGVWAAGQVGALALAAYYLITHVAQLKQSGMAQGIAETWLRKSIFHPGENHVAAFVAAQTLRVFTYLLSHGVGGTLALAAFLIGMISLLNQASSGKRPSSRELALLLALPFVVNCGVALAGLYPYGGTRHNAFLALFGLSGAAIGLAAWKPGKTWVRPLVIFICLALCNLFPAPPPQIKAKNHGRILMNQAAESLRQSAPAGSVLFADYQSGLLLGYYVCGHGVVQTFPPLQSFTRSECGPYTVITARPQEWKFYASDLPDQLASAAEAYGLAAGTKLWLFDAGWITDSAPALRKQSGQLGCSAPQIFGENIFLCQIAIGGKM
jgi:4-amino-4-deoxy-L-arabinose transferase-like glycosyltransferase